MIHDIFKQFCLFLNDLVALKRAELEFWLVELMHVHHEYGEQAGCLSA